MDGGFSIHGGDVTDTETNKVTMTETEMLQLQITRLEKRIARLEAILMTQTGALLLFLMRLLIK